MSTQGQGDVVGPPNTRFVSKPVEIEAHRIGIDPWPDAAWEAVTRNEIRLYDCGKPDGYIIVRTLEGEMRGNHGDWLIRGTEGEFYPCKPSVFERKYEARTLLSSSRGEQGWRTPDELPELEDGARLAVYLAFDTGEVKLADWVAWTETSSEYHASTGVYLGQFPQDGDALYMTDDGFDVRKDDDGRWVSHKHHDDGTKTPFYVVAWTEALKPLPSAPGSVPTSLAGGTKDAG